MQPIMAGIYRHYKGGHYQVLGVAQHTENNDLLVIYISLEGIYMAGPRMRARPLTGTDGFTTLAMDDGHLVPRFSYVGNEIGDAP